MPTIVGAIRLPDRIGWQHAMELLLTGERIDAARAAEIGLVGWVVPHDDLLPEAHRLAERLLRAAPLAARATKEVAMRAQHLPPVEAIRFGETMRKVAAATEDAVEGGRAAASAARPCGRDVDRARGNTERFQDSRQYRTPAFGIASRCTASGTFRGVSALWAAEGPECVALNCQLPERLPVDEEPGVGIEPTTSSLQERCSTS